MEKTKPARKAGLARLLEIAGAKRGLVTAACVLSVLSTVASFIPFVLIYRIIAELLRHAGDLSRIDGPLLLNYGWQALLAMVGSFALMYAAIICSHVAAFQILYQLKLAFTRHLAALPLGFHTANSSGKLRKMLDENIEKIEGFIAHQLPDLAGSMAAPAALVALLLYFDWRLGLTCLAPLLAAFVVQAVAFGGSRSKQFMDRYQSHLEEMNNSAVEYVRGISVVKAFNQTVFSFRKFYDAIMAYKDFALKYTFSMREAYVAFIVILNSLFVLVIPAGILLSRSAGDYTKFVSSFLFYLIFCGAITATVMKLLYVSSSGRMIVSGVDRLDQIFAVPPLPLAANPRTTPGHDIAFEQVSFAYNLNGAEVEALKDVSFRAEAGKVTALVGPSGSGKSTVAHLIPRFWDVQEGAVKIGGVDIRAMDPDYLLSKVSFVFQDVFLFKQSILENIRVGDRNATREQISAAARAAQCHEFILKLPQGYDTVIGSRGVRLSGGERQRLVIARAILKNAPIIVLDEATAFADPENEYLIQRAFKELVKDKTVIIIAHRLSTIRSADQILVLDGGRLVQKGTHAQLTAEAGKYQTMWESYAKTLSWAIS
jgi:ATP-binding cassette subfamily B protein